MKQLGDELAPMGCQLYMQRLSLLHHSPGPIFLKLNVTQELILTSALTKR